MKISLRAIAAAAATASLVALRVSAQDPLTASPPAAPVTNTIKPQTAPKKASARPAIPTTAKRAEAKPAAKPEPVLNPEPGVVRQNNVNVRGQASMNSEVIAHLQKGEPVTLLEEITLKKAKQDEPARWFRIALPTNVSVWVHSSYVDAATKTVKPSKLRLRGGPGENYSVLGVLEKGAAVNPIDTKGEWTKIEPPPNSFGFVAAHLLERNPAPAIVAAPPKRQEVVTAPPPAATKAEPTNPPPVVAEVTPATPTPVPGAEVTRPATTATPPATTPPPVVTAPPVVTPAAAPAEDVASAPIEKVKKVVSREGILKGSVSIQAPTYFELRSLDTGKTVDYVFSPSTNLLLKEFKGKRIIVTGEELLDERWQNTPVIIIDSLQTVP
jgi:uncharacterized protein YgiM (DUF1202 family)